MFQSPLNYTGGKYKLLPQMLPLFPTEINTFVDLFCGGCNVGLNVKADKYIYNDRGCDLQGLYQTMKETDKAAFIAAVDSMIERYGLSQSSCKGYSVYHCESSSGLGAYNRAFYMRLRNDFNRYKEKDLTYYVMLYVLIIYSFNNQIRFNSSGHFNLPVGKRDFNLKMREKLGTFIDTIQRQDCIFSDQDFREFDYSLLCPGDFLYADPPYLITCASYNEQNGWTEKDEYDLLDILNALDQRGIKFALSNVVESKGAHNRILEEWIQTHSAFKVNKLEYTYKNSNYQRKNKTSNTQEVLVTNY